MLIRRHHTAHRQLFSGYTAMCHFLQTSDIYPRHLEITTLIDIEIDQHLAVNHIEEFYYLLSCQLLAFYEAKQISHRH